MKGYFKVMYRVYEKSGNTHLFPGVHKFESMDTAASSALEYNRVVYSPYSAVQIVSDKGDVVFDDLHEDPNATDPLNEGHLLFI